MSSARFLVGDVFEQIATLPDDSVDLVFTSPPFLALRSYLPADHPDKAKELGSESTPADFLDRMLDVVEACDRVLAPHGSLCFELGDTYSGSGGAGGDYSDDGLRDGQPKFSGSAKRAGLANYADGRGNPDGMRDSTFSGANTRTGGGFGWPEAKSLTGIPTLFAWSLAYGRNLLRPERETPRWRVRNLIPWCRPNPPVGALGDKFRPATSYVTVACKSKARWFDLDAVRGESQDTRPRNTNGPKNAEADAVDVLGHYDTRTTNPNGAPPLDFLVLPTQPFKGAHYATFPEALVKPFVESMCPREVCRVCGEPRRRITGEPEYVGSEKDGARPDGVIMRGGKSVAGMTSGSNANLTRVTETLGWSDCSHADYRRGVVLDPFCGSGTTLAVATGLGRDAIGIDLDERNVELARERCGMFLTAEAS